MSQAYPQQKSKEERALWLLSQKGLFYKTNALMSCYLVCAHCLLCYQQAVKGIIWGKAQKQAYPSRTPNIYFLY